MPPPRKADPQIVLITVAALVVLAIFIAYCWWGSHHPEFVPTCRGGSMKGVPIC
jgi:hypothetical protein